MTLYQFVNSNRDELIRCCEEKVARRFAPIGVPIVVDHGVPLFLLQLVEGLELDPAIPADTVADPDPAQAPSEIHRAAVDIAIHAYSAIRTGNVGLTGATGALLVRSLGESHPCGSLRRRYSPGIRNGHAGPH